MGKIIGGGLPVGAIGGKVVNHGLLALLVRFITGTLSGTPCHGRRDRFLTLLKHESPYNRLNNFGNTRPGFPGNW